MEHALYMAGPLLRGLGRTGNDGYRIFLGGGNIFTYTAAVEEVDV
jgi:hypothetical protein